MNGGDSAELCICHSCRRFWLERNGWPLSKRETLALVRNCQVGRDAEPREDLATAARIAGSS